MKKLFTIIAFLCLQQSYAQVYIGFNTQVSKAINGYTLDEILLYDYATTLNNVTIGEVNASFGGGMFYGLSIGTKFNTQWDIELNVGYRNSNKVISHDAYTIGDLKYTFASSGWSIRPSFIFNALQNNKKDFYAKFGPVFSQTKLNLSKDGEFKGQVVTHRINISETFSGTSGLGYQAAIGVKWRLSNKLALCTEMSMINLVMSPTSSELTRYEIDGASGLDTLTVRERKTDYKKQIIITGSPSDNEPSQVRRPRIPYDGIGLNVALRWYIGRKEKK